MTPSGTSESVRNKYSDHEIEQMYALARFYLESGELKKAETICRGLTSVAPDYPPAWLALSYVHVFEKNYEEAVHCAGQALKSDPDSTEAQLFLASCLLSLGDFNAAGTHLGEVGDKVDSKRLSDPSLLRFYRIQLARFQNR